MEVVFAAPELESKTGSDSVAQELWFWGASEPLPIRAAGFEPGPSTTGVEEDGGLAGERHVLPPALPHPDLASRALVSSPSK